MADYATSTAGSRHFDRRSVDRIFLQACVPKLQSMGGVCQFLHWQKGFGIPSSAAFGRIGDAYAAQVHRWAAANGIPVRRFARGESKDEIACPLIDAAKSISRSIGRCAPRRWSATPATFGIGRRVTAENWKALRAVGELAN